jgi:hypothetical protein
VINVHFYNIPKVYKKNCKIVRKYGLGISDSSLSVLKVFDDKDGGEFH